MQETLMERTQRLLHESDMSLPDVHAGLKAAGHDNIGFYWLRKFSAGEFKDPGVNKVQTLYEYLTGKVLLTA